MDTKLFNQAGELLNTVSLPDRVFAVKFKPDLVRQVVLAQIANSRQVIAHTKGRGEVRGGGKKPWRQKGTGRARHASIRSPIWKGGGVVFGPTKERNYKQKINKRMKRQALLMVLSAKARDNELLLLENLQFTMPKTKEGIKTLQALSQHLAGYRWGKKQRDSILLVTPQADSGVKRVLRNLPFTAVTEAKNLNIRDLLESKYLVLLQAAVPVIEKTYKF